MCSELTPLDGPELGLALAPSTICPQSVAQIATFSQRQHGRPTQEAAEWRAEHQLAAAREASAAFAAAPGSRVHQPASQWQSFPATSGQWAPTTSGLSLGALAPLQLSTKRAVWASSMPPVAARPSSQPAAHRVSYKPADETSEHRAQESPSWEHCESGSRVQQASQQICMYKDACAALGLNGHLTVAALGALLATLPGFFCRSSLWPSACCTHHAVMPSCGHEPIMLVWHCRCS